MVMDTYAISVSLDFLQEFVGSFNCILTICRDNALLGYEIYDAQ